MAALFSGEDKSRSYGTALLRIVTGLILLQGGYQMVFVTGLSALATNFQTMGVPLPQLTAPLVGSLELIGGALLVCGIFTRYLGLIFAVEFVVTTYAKVAMQQRPWDDARLDVLLVVICLFLATNGGGAFNLGSLLKKGH